MMLADVTRVLLQRVKAGGILGVARWPDRRRETIRTLNRGDSPSVSLRFYLCVHASPEANAEKTNECKFSKAHRKPQQSN